MLPNQEQSSEATTAAPRVGHLVTGDLGLIVLRGLLESGVGYVVSSWQERPTPIDVAIDDARNNLLQRQGMVLRRLRSLSALEPLIVAPSGGVAGSTPRGAVVFAGRNGLRASLEQFCNMQVPGGVVGYTFDVEATHIADALVIDPEPTAAGVLRATAAAFEASARCGRPALVVLRERAIGMRGTIRMAVERSPIEAAVADAAIHRTMSVAGAARHCGLINAHLGPTAAHPERVIVVAGPLAGATSRALALVSSERIVAGVPDETGAIAVVSLGTPGLLPDRDDAIAQMLMGASDLLVLGARARQLSSAVRKLVPRARVTERELDPGTARGERVGDAVRAWLDRDGSLLPAVSGSAARAQHGPLGRVPKRTERLHRSVRPTLAAGLALAQGVIGVPRRIDASFPSYATEFGVTLSVVPGEVFVTHGLASGSGAGVRTGVFVITQNAAGLEQAVGAAGASIEYVDGDSARAIGAAIARSCAAPRATPHVIVVATVQRIAAPTGAVLGMDPNLLATDRLATAAVPVAAKTLIDLGSDVLAGPVELVLDHPDAHAAIDTVRELSPSTWELRRRTRPMKRSDRAMWQLRRRMLRAVGVDL